MFSYFSDIVSIVTNAQTGKIKAEKIEIVQKADQTQCINDEQEEVFV